MTVTEDLVTSRASAPAVASPPNRPLRVAVFGLGRSGLHHAAVLSTITNVEIVGIGDIDRAARRNARGMGLSVRSYATGAMLLERSTPDVVIVATPYDQTVALASQALEASVSVLIEGVPALSAADASTLVSAAARAERRIACTLPLAYHPVFETARRIVAASTLGALIDVRASRNVSRVVSPAHQRTYSTHGGPRGALAHVGAELVFALVRMFGAPREVSATVNRIYGALEDEARGSWTLEGGTRLGFETSWSSPGYPRAATVIEIDAEFGRMLVSEDAVELDLVRARDEFPEGVKRLGRANMPQAARFELDGDALWLQDAAFLAAVDGGDAAPTELAACLEPWRVIDALYASANDGGSAVEVAR